MIQKLKISISTKDEGRGFFPFTYIEARVCINVRFGAINANFVGYSETILSLYVGMRNLFLNVFFGD